ncbi:zinc finger matrin-type protein 2-like [Rhopilema esculentum]|uniref:zinc finger matrin-type protein 2-like n=1 Tax=Rhopilema esculentum TaxID=499914 RepID=UPI0031D85B4A|eukprot:gene12053-2644_t
MSSGSSKNPEGKVDNYRRTWDKEEFEKKAKERLQEETGEDGLSADESDHPVKRELLQARSYAVDLDSKLGKNTIITKTTPLSEVGGYYCNVCDCVVKDSINFLDHINGRKHQRNLGMSMRVERSSLDQVKKRFESNKRKKEEEKKKQDYDFESRVKELREEEERVKQKRKDNRKERKRKAEDTQEEYLDNDVAALMGFGGFGSSKK